MPYFYDPNLEHDDDQNPGSAMISGASPTTENTGDAAPNTAGRKDIETGSGFQNLDKYLQTNQSREFGQEVLGKVQDKVTDASNQMNTAADQFKTQVSSANILPNMGQVNQAIAKPKEADAKQFQNWMDETYKGPNSLAESQDVWNKYWSGVNQAQTNSKLLGNEAGRFTLLDQYFGRPSYNYGEKSLDNLLIQEAGLGRETRDLQNQATQLRAQGTEKSNELNTIAGQRAGEVEQNRNSVLQAIGLDAQGNVITGDKAGAIGKQYADVYAQVAAQNAARKAQQDAVRANLAKDAPTSAELQALGLSPGQNLYNLDITKYLTPGGDLNRDQVMTPEQRAYIQALSELSGTSDTFASGLRQDPSAAYTYDANKLRSDATAKQGEYQRSLQETPVKIPSQWTSGGRGDPISLAELRTRIGQTQARQNSDGPNEAERRGNNAFLNDVIPILQAAEANLANQFQINRKLSLGDRARVVDEGPSIRVR